MRDERLQRPVGASRDKRHRRNRIYSVFCILYIYRKTKQRDERDLTEIKISYSLLLEIFGDV